LPGFGAGGLTAADGALEGLFLGGGQRRVDAVGPVGGPGDRPGGRRGGVLLGGGAGSEAAPSPVLGPFHQARPQRVALDVTADGVKMLVALHRERLEPSLVQVPRAGGMMVGVPAPGVGHGQPPHEPGEIAVAVGPDHQMEMVGHRAVGEQPHVVPRHSLGRNPLERREIAVVVEDRQTRVGPVQHMINEAAFSLVDERG